MGLASGSCETERISMPDHSVLDVEVEHHAWGDLLGARDIRRARGALGKIEVHRSGCRIAGHAHQLRLRVCLASKWLESTHRPSGRSA
jgi:hypothetical protein